MPELGVHQTALLVNCIRHPAPSPNLLSAPQTGSISPTISIGADLGAFADDETGRGALRLVFGVKFGGRMLSVGCTHAGKRCHYDPVP